MANKEGRTVSVTQTCTDENGEVVSDLSVTWYGFDLRGQNIMASDIVLAMMGVTDAYNEAMFGEDWKRGR